MFESVVISSRIRLARCIRGLIFSPTNDFDNVAAAKEISAKALDAAKTLFVCSYFPMSAYSSVQKASMVERHLISPKLTENNYTGGLILSEDETVSIMLFEEDHIRAQCILSGLALKEAYTTIDRYDNALSARLPLAFDAKLGYLTACVTNVGTGLRASTMLFLPALTMLGEADTVFNALIEGKFTVRGVYGEGSGSTGCVYQISNSKTLGFTENEIVSAVQLITVKIAEKEMDARRRLKEKLGYSLMDKIARAYAVLCAALELPSSEFTQLMTYVKLGVDYKLLPNLDLDRLNRLSVQVQPNSLSLIFGTLSAVERDRKRADFVRRELQYCINK